jgi:hypothetical protein
MRHELRRLPGWSVRAEIHALDRSVRVFTGNANELSQFLGKYQEPANAVQLWALDNRDGFERFLDEVDRLLHNFLSAAATIRDHDRRVRRRLLPDDLADDLGAQYQQRVDRDFACSPVAQFVQQLRHFALHRRLPIARGQLSGVPGVSFETRIILHPSDLLKWGKWSLAAKRYIESAGDDIPIEEAVTEYEAAVVAFHEWFREALRARHLEDLRALEQAEARVEEAWRRAVDAPLSDMP